MIGGRFIKYLNKNKKLMLDVIRAITNCLVSDVILEKCHRTDYFEIVTEIIEFFKFGVNWE